MEEVYKGVKDMSSLGEAVFQEGMEKGIEKGIEEGEKKKQLEIAKSMLMKNLPIEIISDCTGLSREEIKNLR